ncbi:MAG: hypothetical protein IB618_03915 [Candidatus Pacearchaeota archaeon]|nr:MAG: hypothetical protein IB618_03915 [Candidatus Pacearchaeota archaeon]
MNKDIDLMIKSIKINNPGISEEILKAFRVVDRKFFVRDEPYRDEPKHVAHGQTISQPSTVARMLVMSRLERGMDVLEIGTNTGYHAALVAFLVFPSSVMTIEIFPDLAKKAKKNMEKFLIGLKKEKKKVAARFSKLNIFAGDALDKKTEIWNYKYDRIYFTASVDSRQINEVKKMALKLLKEKGLLLYPTREAWDYGALEIWQKKGKKLEVVRREEGYAFVPLLKKEELEEMYEKRKLK